jgi:hypothetical protein
LPLLHIRERCPHGLDVLWVLDISEKGEFIHIALHEETLHHLLQFLLTLLWPLALAPIVKQKLGCRLRSVTRETVDDQRSMQKKGWQLPCFGFALLLVFLLLPCSFERSAYLCLGFPQISPPPPQVLGIGRHTACS